MLEPLSRITKDILVEQKGMPIPEEYLNTTELLQKVRTGELTPEQALEKKFPTPFTKISDVVVDNLIVSPLTTGFRILDDNLVFKQDRAELIVVGAGTSHGKSAFMVQISAEIAKIGPVFIFSLEMDERDIKARLLAPRSKLSLSQILKGHGDRKALLHSAKELDDLDLYLCCNGRRDVSYITQTSYDAARKYGKPSLIVCDYLQLMKGPTKATRTSEIAEILGTLKELAKTLKCPVLIGSQLNRECERRGKSIEMSKGVGDYRPIKSDLMDSGSIEHDADVIMFISRQYVYDRTRPGEADFVIAKNRNGSLYNGVLGFRGEYCSFYEEIGL